MPCRAMALTLKYLQLQLKVWLLRLRCIGLSWIIRKLFCIPSQFLLAFDRVSMFDKKDRMPSICYGYEETTAITLDPSLSRAMLQKDLKAGGEARVFQNVCILRRI